MNIPVILCIDDEELGLEIRKIVLEREGYSVLTAGDGPTGLALFDSRRFDAVILDYVMPGLDGGQVALRMRQSNPEIPIILLSAYDALPEEVSRAVDITIAKGDGALILIDRLKELLHPSEKP